MKKKRIPLRKCVGCGESKPKKELIRVVRNKEGQVNIDQTGKAKGRGAYICKGEECINKAIKEKKLNRSLKIDIPKEIYEEIKKVILENE
ncbi:RNase P modulator RnpM [Thermohalobacter berrensis]|uniref:Nucleic acid-binding protein n=1 Tax=Thermohalobacter berrensis TaxID=99594 RepID=A0A419TAH2_9FIRM|nr:YlxR family protein [Thermohalobacter berrensis]RKD34476.1 nucleic acid-binding protein [Thermohalobacter berrensis]